MKLFLSSVVGLSIASFGLSHREHHMMHHGMGGAHGHHSHNHRASAEDHNMKKKHDHHNSLRPHTHVAWHHVETACAEDVEEFCIPPEPQQLQRSLGDPFLDWIFLPPTSFHFERVETERNPVIVELDSVNQLMDQMLNSFFSTPLITYSAYVISAPKQEEPEQQQQHAEAVADASATKLASSLPMESIPDLAVKLESYGQKLMDRSEEGSVHHHFARRLTEISSSPHKLKTRVSLPFGCQKNACLYKMLEWNKLSEKCAHSIQELEVVNQLEKELEERQDTVMNLMTIYLVLLVVVLLLIVQKTRRNKIRRRLRHRILQAIYSSPELKAQVEQELGGESIGHTPPIPYLALKLMSAGGRDLKRSLRCMKRIHMIFFGLLSLLVFAAPMIVLPICILITFFRIVHMCSAASFSGTEECQCCCCGTTTTEAALGIVTEDQACCSCCKGTGVCSPSCKDCCGPKSCSSGDGLAVDGCCCCCNCCNTTQLEDDCTCCCCGASVGAAKAGLLTAEQECCNCCKGTGKCSAACDACCGGDGCCCCSKDCCCDNKSLPPLIGRGQKHVFQSQKAVYQGIPVQIV